ncbi:hypothetical protein Tco_0597446 [Tanacetum coccineum]
MLFRGNTRDLGSFGEETDEITDLHQIHDEILFSEHGDIIVSIKRCRRDLSSDGVRDLVMASGDYKQKKNYHIGGVKEELSNKGEEAEELLISTAYFECACTSVLVKVVVVVGGGEEDMDSESAHMVTAYKVPILKSGYVRLDNQSIERDRLIGIGFVLNFVKFISFTFAFVEIVWEAKHQHGLYETIVCYVLLANVIWIVVLERDRLKALVDLSVTVSLLWIVDSERDRLIVVDRGTRSVPLFVRLSVTVSTWFVIGFKGELNGAKIERSG